MEKVPTWRVACQGSHDPLRSPKMPQAQDDATRAGGHPGSADDIHASADWSAVFAIAGIDGGAVFTDPRVKVWRRLDGRENAVLQLPGAPRLHVKRYLTPAAGMTPAETEARALNLLTGAGVGCPTVAGWGQLADGRSFIMTEDLAGHASCQEILRNGGTFSEVLKPTAAVAAALHRAGLHHRDLYLCHFFLRSSDRDCRLIDAARVGPLPRWLARRWIVKDLGGFAFSTREFNAPEAQLAEWFAAYGAGRGLSTAETASLFRSAVRKADAIARHDARLRLRQPDRNISIAERPPR